MNTPFPTPHTLAQSLAQSTSFLAQVLFHLAAIRLGNHQRHTPAADVWEGFSLMPPTRPAPQPWLPEVDDDYFYNPSHRLAVERLCG